VADDTIELAGMWFGFALGPLAEARFVVGTAAADRNDNIIYNSTTGDLFYDSDGSDMAAMPIQFARLTGAPALTYADFVVV
jgi:serralysin